MIPYIIFISIILFFVMSYFKIGVPTPKWLKTKSKSSPKVKVENLTKDQKYNHIKVDKEEEADRILDKIYENKKLTPKERKFLDEYSRSKK